MHNKGNRWAKHILANRKFKKMLLYSQKLKQFFKSFVTLYEYGRWVLILVHNLESVTFVTKFLYIYKN